MNKAEKKIEVEKMREHLSKAQVAILTDYKGLKVSQMTELRKKLRAQGSEMHVLKNRLAKLAVKDTPIEILVSHFTGTTALTSSDQDPVSPAKILVNFEKDNALLKFKAAALNGKTLSKEQVVALAKLPSREELLAKLLGSMMAPARNLVTVLVQIPRQLVNVLAAVRDKKEKEG